MQRAKKILVQALLFGVVTTDVLMLADFINSDTKNELKKIRSELAGADARVDQLEHVLTENGIASPPLPPLSLVPPSKTAPHPAGATAEEHI